MTTLTFSASGRFLKKIAKTTTDFIRYPQVPLHTNTTYQLKVMENPPKPGTKGWVAASTYEWASYDSIRINRYKTKP